MRCKFIVSINREDYPFFDDLISYLAEWERSNENITVESGPKLKFNATFQRKSKRAVFEDSLFSFLWREPCHVIRGPDSSRKEYNAYAQTELNWLIRSETKNMYLNMLEKVTDSAK